MDSSSTLRSSSSEVGSVRGISCSGVSSGYLGQKVLDGVSFEVVEPAIYVVLGPNGAGKTTLFRTVAGILTPYDGAVKIDGESIDRQSARDRLHFLSTVDGIPDGLTVAEALRFYARVQGAGEQDVERVLALLEISSLRDRVYSQLSTGQKKRVSIARIFLREREIYLLDEPTANLDPTVAAEIRGLILGLSRDKIVLYSSHNLYEARDIGQYVLALKQGRVAFFGDINSVTSSKYLVGVRVIGSEAALTGVAKKGEYFVYELTGPEHVAPLIRDLEAKGVQLREVKEMGNPLEELFTQ
ncbi:MAG: heme ABC exporter ATP-binding protein CcmA [Thermoplasmata archaeon]